MAARRENGNALVAYDLAAETEPHLPGLQAARGLALFQLRRLDDALAAYTAALSHVPNDPDTWVNLGVLYQMSGYYQEAYSCFETALKGRPDFIAALSNRAKAERALGQMAAATESFGQVVSRQPDNASALFDLAVSQLMLGDYAAGWAGYEARHALQAEPPILPGRWPVWRGEPLDGQRILVVSEQGLGDVFQFMRYLVDLQALGGDVTLRVPASMIPLLSGLRPSCRLVADLTEDAAFDFEIALLSLPLRLTPDCVRPSARADYLVAPANRIRPWSHRLDDGSDALRIGIAWQGNPDFIDDAKRSIPLSAFGRIARVTNIRLISLQGVPGLEQLDASNLPVERLGDAVDQDGSFIDTAAIMMGLDLVITSDTAMAHLAGALGRPVWVALALVPDWRWGMTGETTPWYPTMRLFRQSVDGDWDGVFATIRDELEAEFDLNSRILPAVRRLGGR